MLRGIQHSGAIAVLNGSGKSPAGDAGTRETPRLYSILQLVTA